MKKPVIVAYGGILTALSVLFVYLAYILPTGKLFFLCATSVLPVVLLDKRWVSTSVISYFATSVLALILIANQIYSFSYVLFFGLFPLIKHATSHMSNKFFDFILMFIFSNISLACYYLLFILVFNMKIDGIIPLWLLILLIEIAIFIYLFLFDKIKYYFLKFMAPIINRLSHK